LDITILVQTLTVSHNKALPYWYRHSQYNTTEHCHIGTGTDSFTQQTTAILVQTLTISQNRALPYWYRHSITQQSRPLLSRYTTFIQRKLEGINSNFLVTCVSVPDLYAHGTSRTTVTMAALWYLGPCFHCVRPYPHSTIMLPVVHGNYFIFNLQRPHTIHGLESRSVCVPNFTF